MGTADFAAMKRELQRSHMHLNDGSDDYRRGSSYKQSHSEVAGTIHDRARADHAQARFAAMANKGRALGTSVQDALREDL